MSWSGDRIEKMNWPGDQDEEVEEEEEFHEVDEEKHKTSQESMNGVVAPTSAVSNVTSNDTIISTDGAVESGIEAGSTSAECQSEKLLTTEPKQAAETPEGNTQANDAPGESLGTKHDASEKEEKRSNSENSGTSRAFSSDSASTATANFSTARESNIESSDVVDNGESQCESDNKNVDWANIMLASARSDKSTTDDDSPVSEEQPFIVDSLNEATEDRNIDDIIAATKEHLIICDDSCSTDKNQEQAVVKQDAILPESESVKEEIVTVNNDDAAVKEDPTAVKDEQENPSDSAEEVKTEPAQDGVEGSEKTDEPEKKELDMDEDVKNPQYIPKKGIFYEHDDRSHDIVDSQQASSSLSMDKTEDNSKEVGNSKKVVTQEKTNEHRRSNTRRQRTEADRWNHDLFRDEKQKPKSKTELINVYGYDIRNERAGRNQTENRSQRGNNTTSIIAPSGHDDQRSRQPKEVRPLRQNRLGSSNERKPRRQNNPRNNNRNENAQVPPKREGLPSRSNKPEAKDGKDGNEEKQPSQNSSFTLDRRDREPNRDNKSVRNDSKGRRRTSHERPTNVAIEKLPKPNAVMLPITVWTNEDTANAESFKESPTIARSGATADVNPQQSLQQAQNQQQFKPRARPNESWEQGQSNKGFYQDKIVKNPDENRHYNSRNRSYQDRGDAHRPAQSMTKNQWNDRSNQHYTEWHRANNSGNYGKSSDYIVKTQTFENSRLSQANSNRSEDRDLRELLNARRMHGQQNFQSKLQLGSDQHGMQHRGQAPSQHTHNQFPQTTHFTQQQQAQQQAPQHALQRQLQQQQQQQHPHHHHHHQQQQQLHHHPQHTHQHPSSQQLQHQLIQQHQPHQQIQQSQPTIPTEQHLQPQLPTHNSTRPQSPQANQQQAQSQRQKPATQVPPHQNHSKQNVLLNTNAGSGHDVNRLGTGATNSNDSMNSRPIIKTDAYSSAGVASHQQPSQQQQQQQQQQYSQSHRAMGGPMVPQGPAGTHLVPSHIGAGGAPAQYYSLSNNARDPTGAAPVMAAAYHGYMPGGHSLMDTSRYHLASQQLSDHGYMAPAGQTNVASASVMHQQGMYAEAAATDGPSSTYLTQAGSGLPTTSNIPVTGAGPPPLPPYLQHSQYQPSPYSNPYTQPQHNQAPSGHAYPPHYWNYI